MATSFPYERCVFVNCPFDKPYKPILDAILFAIYDCGFIARTALEDKGAGQTRIEKLRTIIEGSLFSIHDLSHVKLEVGRLGVHHREAFEIDAELRDLEAFERADRVVAVERAIVHEAIRSHLQASSSSTRTPRVRPRA